MRELRASRVGQLEHGIGVIRFRPDIGLEADDVDEMETAMEDIFKGTLHATLVDAREMMFFSQSARDRAAQKERKFITGMAVLTASALQRTLANVYLTVSRPKLPTKLFTDQEKALEWLRERNSERRSNPPSR